MFKIWCRFKKWKKNSEKVFCFSDNCIWIGSCKFSQPGTGDLPSAVNVLTKMPKISPNTRGDIFQNNFAENFKWKWSNRSQGDFASSWDAFTCWWPKPVLKRCSWESFLTRIFTVSLFGNILVTTIIFSYKMFKILCRIQKWNEKWRKGFSFLRSLQLNWELQILTIFNRIFAIGCQCLNRQPYYFTWH